MRPYFAVVKDSFREALRSPVLWISLALVTIVLLLLAPLGSRTETTTQVSLTEVLNWEALINRIHEQSTQLLNSPGKRIWSQLEPSLQKRLVQLSKSRSDNRQEYEAAIKDFRTALNKLLLTRDFYDESAWRGVDLGKEGRELLARRAQLSSDEASRFHRVALERAYVGLVSESPDQYTVLTYAGATISPEWMPPVKPELFRKGVRYILNTGSNWFVGGLGVLAAVVITAPIMPRMFDTGQLHLLLSKPVSRSLLLISQYLGACIYIALIVTYLAVGLWLILGWRFQMWEARLLWIIPIYILVFAIYYTVSTVAAVVTRSAIVAVMISMLFWGLCLAVGTAKVDLDRRARVSQFNRIIPAGDQILAVNEHNTVFAWNESQRRWDRVFVSPFQNELRKVSWLPLPAMPPLPGVVYDPAKKEIISIEKAIDGPVSSTLAVGRESQDWEHTSGTVPPMGAFAMFREPNGKVLIAASLGLFRLRGDPTAPRKPVKVLGMELPVSSGAVFQDVSPVDGLVLAPPSAAAIDPKSGEVLVYSRGDLLLLKPSKDKFTIAVRSTIEAKDTEVVLVALVANHVLLGRADGRLQTLDRATLKEQSSVTLQANSRPRFLYASPDGRRAAATFHNETLWLYDSEQDAWTRARVVGQRDVSVAQWSDDGALLVADQATRITAYDGETLAVKERYAPPWSIMSVSYRYVISPLYFVLPKPGELYKTFDYLVATSDDATVDADEANVAKSSASPLIPVWSGLAFIACMLLATCLYFERQEY
jgi:hypothetical protein